MPSERALPNVILIVLDTARADAFEPYGAGIGASPAIGDLARRGSAVSHAIATSNWTMPSHVSMFSGLLPRTIGLARAPQGKRANCRRILQENAPRLLASVLRDAGYATAGVSCNPWISVAGGFATGFDRFVDVKGERRRQIHEEGTRARMSWALEGMLARVDDGASQAERTLRGWLAEAPTQPFFWFVNLIECHSPYMPPRPYNDLSPRVRARVAEEARAHLTLLGIWRASAGRVAIPPETLGRMRHLYGRSILLMDDWIARLLDSLDRAHLLDDTLLVVTSDHGENLGEDRLIGHAFSLDDRLIRVPLVSAGPGAFPSNGVTSLAALPRMIAGAVGVRSHPWEDGALPQGVAVSQYDALIGAEDERFARAVSDWRLDETGARRISEPGTSATDGRFKLVRQAGEDRLYDLGSDPMEQSPVPPDGSTRVDPATLAMLRLAVDRHHGPEVAVEDAAGPAGEDDGAESAELEERLRLLGYL